MDKLFMKKVLVLYDKMFLDVVKSKLQNHCQLLIRESNEPFARTLEKARECNVIICNALTWQAFIRAAQSKLILESAAKLELFATTSVGYDHLDLDYLKARNVQVTNSPGVSEYAVAESAVCLAIAAAKRLEEARRAIVNGQWKREFEWMLGQDIRGSTTGIVGLGNIGTLIAKYLRVMGVSRVLYSSRTRKLDKEHKLRAEYVAFDELLQQSDFVFACVPLTSTTSKIFNHNAFEKMKNNGIFINISRGGIVEQDDLIHALKSGTIFAAGLDCTTPEPLPVNHELTKLSNCVLMPHIGSGTVNARQVLIERACDNVLAFLENKPLLNQVIF